MGACGPQEGRKERFRKHVKSNTRKTPTSVPNAVQKEDLEKGFCVLFGIALPGLPPRCFRTGSRLNKCAEMEALGFNSMFFKAIAAYSWETFEAVSLSCIPWMVHT